MTGAIPPHLDVAVMDKTHDEAYALLDELKTCPDEVFPALFSKLVDHTKNHFEHENQVMTETGYGGITEHLGEHGRILGDLTQFSAALKRGRIGFVRAYVAESLPDTLDGHIRSADSALAAHLKKLGDTRKSA